MQYLMRKLSAFLLLLVLASTAEAEARKFKPKEVHRHVLVAARRHKLSPALLHAVIQIESKYDSRAMSRAGNKGLMQLGKGTARAMGVRDPLDPRQNILGGARYLRRLLNDFGKLELALAAYNAGPGTVRRFGGVPPFRQTQQFVRKVLAHYKKNKNTRLG